MIVEVKLLVDLSPAEAEQVLRQCRQAWPHDHDQEQARVLQRWLSYCAFNGILDMFSDSRKLHADEHTREPIHDRIVPMQPDQDAEDVPPGMTPADVGSVATSGLEDRAF